MHKKPMLLDRQTIGLAEAGKHQCQQGHLPHVCGMMTSKYGSNQVNDNRVMDLKFKDKLKNNRKIISEILRFGITGCLATVFHYLVYYILKIYINLSVAFTLGYVVSFVFNYIMSARFTFKKKTSAKNGLGFCAAHIINYLLQIGLLNFFVYVGVHPSLAPIPVYCISIPVNFTIVRFVFNRK